MKIKMINDYVLVRQIEAQNKSTGGIILGNVEPPCVGMVISVGEGKVLPNGQIAEHNICVGDMVVFGRSSLNTPITEDLGGGEDTYYVMKIEEIFGKKSNV